MADIAGGKELVAVETQPLRAGGERMNPHRCYICHAPSAHPWPIRGLANVPLCDADAEVLQWELELQERKRRGSA